MFFLETSEEKPTINHVEHTLRNYGAIGVFDRVAALLFGRPRDYTDDEKAKLEETILQVVRDEFGATDLSIVTNVDVGHTDPQLIMPLGVEACVNPQERLIALTEPWAASR